MAVGYPQKNETEKRIQYHNPECGMNDPIIDAQEKYGNIGDQENAR
jgi:hypothetical protein